MERTHEHRPEDAHHKFNDFRGLLQSTLISRCRDNAQYSLRAFAKFLSIEPSSLSKILNGKRSITPKMYERLAKAMNLSDKDYDFYHPLKQQTLSRQEIEYRQLTADSFQFISDWYHYAILELLHINNFRQDFTWIARTLGISKSQVEDAIDRLFRLGFIKEDESGKWLDSAGKISTVGNEFSTVAFRNLQKQVLRMAIEAMDTVNMNKRDQSSITMAIDSSKIPQAKEIIKRFRRELCELLEAGSRDEVYNLAISLYPITDLSCEMELQ